MQIYHTHFSAELGYISLENDGRFYAFIVVGKDEAMRVLREKAEDDPHLLTVLGDIVNVPLPEMAVEATIEMEGTFVRTLAGMASYSAQISDGQMSSFLSHLRSSPCCLLLSNEASVQDAVLGYVDDARVHHLVVFFSKEQGEEIVRGMRTWLPKKGRRPMLAAIDQCALPNRSRRQMIELPHALAGYLNCAYLIQRGATSGPAH